MLVRPRVHQEWELLKWVGLFALASALSLALANTIAGAGELPPPADQPALLPSEIESWSSPMDVGPVDSKVYDADLAMRVWQAIDAQHREDYAAAVAMWEKIRLPCDADVWRDVALGQAYLATGELASASRVLHEAEVVAPLNPVVHYYLGLLRLGQANVADQWNDAIGSSNIVLASHGPRSIVPNTKSMYELAAINEFEEAVTYAQRVDLYASLVPEDWPTEAALAPIVHDLLLALRADNFEAKSHNVLGSLYLERGALANAERHMDLAVDGGVSVATGYSELAERYETAGQHADAARAYLKASQQEPDKMPSLRKAWKNLWHSVL